MPTILPVDDPADPRLEPYRDIRERDLVGRDGCFVAEGEVVLATLIASPRHQTLSLLLDARRVERLMPLLAPLADAVPVYAASRAVLDAVAGFPLHRGILALGRKPAPRPAADLLADPGRRATVVVALGIANHDNIGGIFRNAAAFAADALLTDARCCDPYYRKALRVSVGHVLSVPHARLGPDEDPLRLLLDHGFEVLALTPRAPERLVDIRPAARTAILLGTEGPGLDAAVLARARPIAIPMAPGVDSLNVAATSAVVLHHLAMRD